MANKAYQDLSTQPSGSMTKMRAEQIKSEDSLGSLAIDLEALRGQVKDIIGAADYKEEITGEYAKVQIVDLAAHIDASGATSLAIKQDMSLAGDADFNGALDVSGAADLHGAVYAYSTFRADGAADLNDALDVAGASDLHGAVVAYSTFNAKGAADLDSTLNVDGASDLVGAVHAHSTLDVDSEATLASAIIEDITAQHIMYAGVGGAVEGSASLKWDGSDIIAASAKVSDLTAQRIVFAGASGSLDDSANLKWDGSDLIVASAKVSDLTAGRVTYAAADGALVDDAQMTYAAGVLTVSGSTYGNSAVVSGNLTVNGNFVVEGDTVTQNVGTVTTEDSVITLNKNGASIPAAGAGIEFESGGAVAGYVKTNGAGDFLMKAATGSELTLDVNAAKTISVAGDLTIEAASFVNQDLTTDAMPEFTKAKLSTLTALRLMASNASQETVSTALNSWVAGTMNRVSVSDNGAGGVTLSGPQDIHAGATPTFANVKASTLAANAGQALKLTVSGALASAAWNDFIEVQAGVGLFLSQSGFKAQVQLAQDIRTTASPTFAGMSFGTYGSVVASGADLKIAAPTGMVVLDDSYRVAGGWSVPLSLAASAAEWTDLETAYGEVSLAAMLKAAAPSSNKRFVFSTEMGSAASDVSVTAAAAPTFPVGAAEYTGGKSDVFVNGQLMAEGAGKDFQFAAPAGTDKVKISFAFSLQSGDVVTLHRYPAA